ncbi:hypothetical protein [Streptomyces sp. CC219B]|uniref:hypothetical protein n=1 Tax=Streptomyces sp. CC219B TaxID=3044574 RepID=UPI0024A96801|nr:hypothetical protein [Streptomyces sp. CC219B]
MTAVVPETSTATPPSDGQCVSTTPTALVSAPDPISWEQLRAMSDSYCGVTTLLAEAGIGLYKLMERDGGSELNLAYTLLQKFVIPPVDERASDEAEEEAIAAEEEAIA